MHFYSVDFIWDIQKKVSEQELVFYLEYMLDLVHMCAEGYMPFFTIILNLGSYKVPVCDSFYEYLLKVWIQGNQTEVVTQYRYFVSFLHIHGSDFESFKECLLEFQHDLKLIGSTQLFRNKQPWSWN